MPLWRGGGRELFINLIIRIYAFGLNLLLLLFTILSWFCHTSTCIHHGCTRVPNPEPHLPPPSPYHPSASSQCTSPKLPVSCIKPGLVIHFLYDIHVSCHSPKSSPASPTESKRLFYTSVSLLLSHKRGILMIISNL